MSIALPWSEFKAYVAEVGPGRGRVARPAQCLFCDGGRVWFNGWRRVLVTLLVDGQPHRLTDWLLLQRVRCAQPPCGRSWTLRPPWLYPHRSLEPDLAEIAALVYLVEPQATYRAVAQRVGCSWGTVSLWIGWLARLVTPAAVLARVARLAPQAAVPALLPRTVAAAARARSRRRDTADEPTKSSEFRAVSPGCDLAMIEVKACFAICRGVDLEIDGPDPAGVLLSRQPFAVPNELYVRGVVPRAGVVVAWYWGRAMLPERRRPGVAAAAPQNPRPPHGLLRDGR